MESCFSQRLITKQEMQKSKKPSVIKDKSFAFSIRVINLYKFLKENNEYVMSKQLLRSGTAIGALVREAEHGESKADFIHKLAIAQKEANETEYWIELLYQSEYLNETQCQSILMDVKALKRILSSIILSSKGLNKRAKNTF